MFRGDYSRRGGVAAARIWHFDFRRSLTIGRNQLGAATNALLAAVRTQIGSRRGLFEQLTGKLEALSPVKILDRGYALVFDASGPLVKYSPQIPPARVTTPRASRCT